MFNCLISCKQSDEITLHKPSCLDISAMLTSNNIMISSILIMRWSRGVHTLIIPHNRCFSLAWVTPAPPRPASKHGKRPHKFWELGSADQAVQANSDQSHWLPPSPLTALGSHQSHLRIARDAHCQHLSSPTHYSQQSHDLITMLDWL